MVTTNPLIEVYCTRPSCQDPINTIPEKNLYTKPIKQRFCANCGMPLILEGCFVTLRPLLPEIERGGFGRTFLGRDLKFPDLPLRVIKQLHPKVSPSECQLADIERLFRAEASVLGKLTHSQIPRAWAFAQLEAPPDLQESTGQSHQIPTFFYLVQDFIAGQNLAQELNQKGQFSEAEIIEILKQLLDVLNYVHGEGVIHRDIKPSNIMRATKSNALHLIDFGAVKQVVVTGVPTAQSVAIGTPDFAPPEQMTGKPVSASSDLYSLAATCVSLLAGKEAQEIREYHTWNWRNYANVNSQLVDILDKMLSYQPEDRYQSAREVTSALSNLQSQPPVTQPSPSLYPQPQPIPPHLSGIPIPKPVATPTVTSEPDTPNNPLQKKNKKLLLLAGGIGALLVGATAFAVMTSSEPELLADNFFSRGEESLLREKTTDITLCKQALGEKQEGMTAFKNQRYENAKNNFQTAIDLFKQATNQCPVDPETLIFLNNAKANIKGNPVTIAAAIPGKNKERNTNISEQILRGVASVQETLNNQDGIEGRLLQVVLARDENNSDPDVEDTAPKVAKQLAKNQIPGDRAFSGQILGVVGHFTSDATLAAGEVYGKEKLVAISPTSTAVRKSQPSEKSKYKYDLSNYVFRTAPNDAVAAADLVDYARQNIGSGNAAVFYDSGKSYSTSLKESFEQKYASLGNVIECDLADSGIDNCQIDENIKLLMLSIGTEEATQASLIISRYKNQPLLGGDSLYNADNVSSTFGEQAKNLVLAVPIHVERTEPTFRSQSVKLWGTQYVGWRAATAYDATQAIVAALKKTQNNPTRQSLYDELNSPSFSTPGATGEVQFNKFHDRQVDPQDDNQLGVLVKVQQKCKPQDNPKYQFCLINE
ncbi:protein kinase domain-containing protein [Calothrix sp. CCY 0018]|uniref:bifunctional serine/threonine-protein kinase/ABC transporter substrate-binding protein n=1 Tax=Calothrix sp. CCY 0018 TaxID=3103864 RepID=UPI0039C5B742